MGMYTELRMNVALKDLTEKEIKAIKWMMSIEDSVIDLPEHPFFNEKRADLLFLCNLSEVPTFTQKDGFWILTSWAEIKNYNNEIELFLEWIKPFVSKGLFDDASYAKTQYEEYIDGYISYYLDHVENTQEIG